MSHTPETITRFLDASLHRMDGPAQWLGTEPNSWRKQWDDAAVRACLVASWPYEQAAGNQSIPAVYKALNLHERFLCDRAYLPATARDMRIMEQAGVPIFGVEQRRPLGDYDVIGTSISYVVLLINWAKMLTMSGIPLRWRDREGGDWPMVLVGGQSWCAPEPMAPIADCIFLGEAEDEPGNGGIGQVFRMIDMFRAEGSWRTDREGCYEQLARSFGYLYFPRFTEVSYRTVDRPQCGPHPSKQVRGLASTLDGMPLVRRKRHVTDLDAIAPLDDPPLLFTGAALGSGDEETSRGCPAWCSFCRLTYAQKPFRQHGVAYSTDAARSLLEHTGGTEIVPFGPDFPMQTNKNQLLASLLSNVTGQVDTVAQRVDDFISDDAYLMLQALGGARTITLGVEGVDQRMRDLVGKATSDEEIRAAVACGIRAGFRRFKLFMILGLPGEDVGDLAKVVDLARDLAAIREGCGQQGIRIQFSFTPLLIEAQTPMQWFDAWPLPNHALIDVIAAVKQLGIEMKIGTKAQRPKVMFFQACQRASRDAGEAIVDVIEAAGIGCWGGVPRDMQERLEAALVSRGFANGLGDLFDERGLADMFGWEFIDTGVDRTLLWRAFRQMAELAELSDSATYDGQFDERYHGSEWISRCDERCLGKACGCCNRADLELRQAYLVEQRRDRAVDPTSVRRVDQRTIAQRVRVRLLIPSRYRWPDSEFWHHLIRRAAYRAERAGVLAIARQSVRLASDGATWRNWSCGTDYAEFAFTRRATEAQAREFLEDMAEHVQPWAQFGLGPPGWELYPAGTLMRPDHALYDVETAEPDRLAARIAEYEAAEYVPMTMHQAGSYFAPAAVEVNAKDYLHAVWMIREGTSPVVRMLVDRRAGPYQAYAALAGKPSWIDAAAFPARCREVFGAFQGGTAEPCLSCGQPLWLSLLGLPWDPELCPRCADGEAGMVLAGSPRPKLALS